ncbi:MAG: hypothetical protein SVU88_01450 [Candidatus Nanohaloarchaea archaeon]|nr:hypothetical protein [Candidatus Nanohaloarchaea archaeon]
MADECTVCGGEMAEEELDEEQVEKIRARSADLADDDVHALVCQECGHVAYRRSSHR